MFLTETTGLCTLWRYRSLHFVVIINVHECRLPAFIGIAAFAAGAFLSVEWQGRIRPMLIPRAEIERLADELMEKHGERAEEMAFIEEDHAWRYSQNFEQGKWRRVRKELERRSRL